MCTVVHVMYHGIDKVNYVHYIYTYYIMTHIYIYSMYVVATCTLYCTEHFTSTVTKLYHLNDQMV